MLGMTYLRFYAPEVAASGTIRPVPASGEKTPCMEDRYANTRQAGTVARLMERIVPDPSIGSHLLSGLSAHRPSVPAVHSFRLANPNPPGFGPDEGDQHPGPCHWMGARDRHLSRRQIGRAVDGRLGVHPRWDGNQCAVLQVFALGKPEGGPAGRSDPGRGARLSDSLGQQPY